MFAFVLLGSMRDAMRDDMARGIGECPRSLVSMAITRVDARYRTSERRSRTARPPRASITILISRGFRIGFVAPKSRRGPELIFRARAKPCRQSRSLSLRPSFGPAPRRAAPHQNCAPQISGATGAVRNAQERWRPGPYRPLFAHLFKAPWPDGGGGSPTHILHHATRSPKR
jgi:hypothetical protein